MPSRKRGSRGRNAPGEPSQMNLFEPPADRALARVKVAAPLRVKTKRIKASSVERPVIFSTREAAVYLGVAVSTLKSWRAKNIGPRWTHRGARLVCYFPEDLDAFLRRGARDPDKP